MGRVADDRFGRGRESDYIDSPGHGRPLGVQHQPTRPVDKEKTEAELSVNIKKATSPEETAPSELVLEIMLTCRAETRTKCVNGQVGISG